MTGNNGISCDFVFTVMCTYTMDYAHKQIDYYFRNACLVTQNIYIGNGSS